MSIFRFSNAGGFGTYQRYNDFLAGNPTTPVITDLGSMFPLGTFTLSSAQSTITFSNIPTTFQHLQLRAIARSTAGGTFTNMNLRVGNGSVDSGSNYTYHRLIGDGASASADGAANQTGGLFGVAGTGAGSNTFYASVIDILDYANANKFKTIRSLSGIDNNGNGTIYFQSFLWRSTSAINTLELSLGGGATVNANSSFALYGIL